MEIIFASFGHLSRFLRTIDRASDAAVSEGLRLAATAIHEKMKPMFGNYQEGIGPYQSWEPLKDSTKIDRITQGFSENDPLLRTGHLRESYEVRSGLLWAGVGSEEEYALVQEVGDPTNNLPPRSTLGIAFVKTEQEASEMAFLPISMLFHFEEREEYQRKIEKMESDSAMAAIADTAKVLDTDAAQEDVQAEANRLRHGGGDSG